MDFEGLFHQLYPPLFRYLNRLTGDADAADDAAQEAFMRLTRQSIPESEVRPWLFTVATNLIRDRARKAERHRRLQGQVPQGRAAPLADVALERDEEIRKVRAVLDQLSERDRTMLLMREEGFKYEEIARAVGVASGSIGTLLARASRRFRNAYVADRADLDINDPSG